MFHTLKYMFWPKKYDFFQIRNFNNWYPHRQKSAVSGPNIDWRRKKSKISIDNHSEFHLRHQFDKHWTEKHSCRSPNQIILRKRQLRSQGWKVTSTEWFRVGQSAGLWQFSSFYRFESANTNFGVLKSGCLGQGGETAWVSVL
jgi:hypothetical protein